MKKQSLNVYRAAKENRRGSAFDNVLKNMGKRFRRPSKKNSETESEN